MSIAAETIRSLNSIGGELALGLAASGSAMGIAAAGMAAVGAWKRCFAQNKPAPFMLAVFVGSPITQTFYGMIVMTKLLELAKAGTPPALIGWGLFGGLAIGASAWGQGKVAASASDALAETGKGFTNYLMALGIVESVAIFVMVFILVFAS
ncbi:MAG: V-type ATP synthase subunit K [Lentisphaerae bacterium]|nr:V-type ATP synthase subunit K [Lentisphaerota bacterium]